MQIAINKKTHYLCQYTVTRDDRSVEDFTLETKTYFLHDICHFVVERNLQYAAGFWGMLARGMAIHELNGKTNLQTAELRFIEQIVGPVQSVYSGHLPEQLFEQFVAHLDFIVPAKFLTDCLSEISSIIATWEGLPLGGQLELDWTLPLTNENIIA